MNVNNNDQNWSDDVIGEETGNLDDTLEVLNNESLLRWSPSEKIWTVLQPLLFNHGFLS